MNINKYNLHLGSDDYILRFNNANDAFEYYYDLINDKGIEFSDTKAIFNTGFYILNPQDKNITAEYRNWNDNYAKLEWQWYLSRDPNANEIAKTAKIWYSCMDENGNVNSNYGYQWSRNNQLQYVIDELKSNPKSRRASISLFDGKEHHLYKRDTVCTYAINFTILNDKLNMSVLMRSNDLWFGFCNDQYCFSLLQELISNELKIDSGTYYHFSQNLHLYSKFLNRNQKII